MEISYDPKHDVMYIRFSHVNIADTAEVEEGVLVDYGENGGIVGIEIIGASMRTHAPITEITFKLEEAMAG